MFKFFAYLTLLLISPQVFGVIFEPPPTDKSVEYLGIIFGTTIGDIYLGGAPNSALSEIMEKFNFIIVVAGLIVVSYAGIMSTINTAQEGTVMGKKWSAIWVPMRSIAGMALMVPSPGSGYSMIQVTVMWIILQGIGAADALWTIVLENVKAGVSPAVGTDISDFSLEQQGKRVAKGLLQSAICMKYYHEAAKSPSGAIPPTDPTEATWWNAQTNHHQANFGAGDWVANSGTSVKRYTEQTLDPELRTNLSPGYPDGGALATTGALAEGQSIFGDSGDPSFEKICGSINIPANVYKLDFITAGNNSPSNADLIKAAQEIYDIKQNTISTMLFSLQPLADKIVDGEITSADTGVATPYINNAAEAYIQLMSSMAVPGGADLDQKTTDLLNQGIDEGWITAGKFYFTFNQTMQSTKFEASRQEIKNDDLYACLEQDPQTQDWQVKATDPCPDLLKLLNAYDLQLLPGFIKAGIDLADNASGTSMEDIPGFPKEEQAAGAGAVLGIVFQGNAQAMESMIAMMSGTYEEPLMAHAMFGKQLMEIAETMWLTIVGITLAMSALAFFYTPLGSGGLSTGFLAVITTLVSLVGGVLLPVCGIMWTTGASLAIYTPFIPFMIFTVAALGWLLVVIESIIAAPLIALGLVIPAGDEMGKVATALMLLANIFLRPMLMLFGFLLAGRVYKAILTLVDAGMVQILLDVNVQTLFSSLMVMVVYVTFVISLTNTSFSLIYAVPDKILRWLGGPAESTGTEALSKAESGAKGGASAIGDDASKGGMAAAGKLSKQGDALAEKAAEPKKPKPGFGETGGKIGPPEKPKE